MQESVDLLAALADDVHTAAQKASRLAYAAGDGTLIPIDRPAAGRTPPANTTGTGSTSRSSPIRPAAWCRSRPRRPGRCTI
ncbi:hypothetical protein GCM10010466_34930 [Planomonospora alba]|uniref:Uncharacterized protein n=1 Tax=Planomonospora alba TaxID=161354 RepID=A0ABP6N9L0_9ACTN